jgi:hypothetical protein
MARLVSHRVRAALLAGSVAAGCAQMGGPPGGPADETAPTVLWTSPAPDSTGVRSPFTIRIAFSEKMDKRSVERGVRLFPPPERVRTSWVGTILLIETDRTALEPSREIGTIAVTLSGGAEDRHGISMRVPYLFVFTSAESLPPGRIAGSIEELSKKSGAPPPTVRAIALARADSIEQKILLETEASLDGAFLVRPLPVDAASKLILLAFQDDDENGEADFEDERYGFSDTLALTPEDPSIDSLPIRLVTADTPGSVEGIAIPPGGEDSLVVAFLPEGDTTRTETFVGPDSTGAYSVTGLPAGEWRVLLVRGSKERMALEGLGDATPVLAERSLRITPGERKEGFRLPEEGPAPQVTP